MQQRHEVHLQPAFAYSAVMSRFTSNLPPQPRDTKTAGNKTVPDSSLKYHFTFFLILKKGKFFACSVEDEKKKLS